MQEKAPASEIDPRIGRLLADFTDHPADARKFKTLEEHLFLAGDWAKLAGVYRTRLSAVAEGDLEALELQLRLGDLLGQRLDDATAAQHCYREILKADPQHPEALAALRASHAREGDYATALQIAELEEQLELSPVERARVLGETATLWAALGDEDEAERRFRSALELDQSCDVARLGLADLLEARGDRSAAAALHEERLAGLRGTARQDARTKLASLLPDDDARVPRLLEEVLEAQPDRRAERERLIALEEKAGRWDKVDAHRAALLDALPEAERAELALAAAETRLREAGDLDGCETWVERALSLAPDDVRAHRLRVRTSRKLGRSDALIESLAALERLEEPSSMRQLEIAVLHERERRPADAIPYLRGLLAEEPDDEEALEVLDRCLARLDRQAERAQVLERRLALADGPEARAELGLALADLHFEALVDPEGAESLYRLVLEHAPEHVRARTQLKRLYRETGRWEELDALILAGAPEQPDGPARAAEWCELGQLRAHTTRDLEGARSAYLQALEEDKSSRDALDALRALGPGRDGDAVLVEACEHELAQGPAPERARDLLRELVQAARRADDPEAARDAAERWVDVEASAESYRTLAELARETGKSERELAALVYLEPLLLSNRDERATCCVRLGELHFASGAVDAAEEAARWYERALTLRPDREVRGRLLDLYRETGQLGQLARHLRVDLLEAPPEEARALRLQLARALAELGDVEAAVQALMPSFEAEPAEAATADLLEGLLSDLSRLDELAAILEKRLAHLGEGAMRRAVAHRLGGVLLDGLGRPDDAVRALRQEVDPGREGPLEELYERALERAE